MLLFCAALLMRYWWIPMLILIGIILFLYRIVMLPFPMIWPVQVPQIQQYPARNPGRVFIVVHPTSSCCKVK